MAGKGPAPTPTAILEARGSELARHRELHGEPRAPAGKPLKPRWLAGGARKIWRQLLARLDALGLMTWVDGWIVERYSMTLDLWRREAQRMAKDTILRRAVRDRNGREVLDKDGAPVFEVEKAPWVGVYMDLCKELSQLEAKLGLTPADRARILTGVQEPPKEADESAKVKRFINFGA